MTQTDPTLAGITAAMTRAHTGHKTEARAALTELWETIGPDGDTFHRCTLAHYLADLQDTAEAELLWDERALAAAADLTDERLQQVHPTLSVAGFLPSLHLNLADDHRRLGHSDLARAHLALVANLSRDFADDAEDANAAHLHSGIDHVVQALDAGSTDRLDTHP
jgi:hypothetical protein